MRLNKIIAKAWLYLVSIVFTCIMVIQIIHLLVTDPKVTIIGLSIMIGLIITVWAAVEVLEDKQ